jgi:hypothetical protein
MQSLLRVTFAGFQPAVLGTKHQATGVQQPSAVGQLAQTQTTDVLGAMPHYRPLPIGVRSGNNVDKLVRQELAELGKDIEAGERKITQLEEAVQKDHLSEELITRVKEVIADLQEELGTKKVQKDRLS